MGGIPFSPQSTGVLQVVHVTLSTRCSQMLGKLRGEMYKVMYPVAYPVMYKAMCIAMYKALPNIV